MKKRKIWLIIAIIGLVVMGCTSPNDNDTNNTTVNLCANGHNMQPVAGEMEAVPTCTQTGFGKMACARTNCTHTENGAEIDALGHEGTIQPFAATCTEAGNNALSGNCVRFAQCNHVVTGAVVGANGHTFNEWEETTPATCDEAAIDTEKCAVCGTLGTETDEGHHALGCHADGDEALTGAIDATCEDDGYTGNGVCVRCGEDVSGESIEAWGHKYHDWTAPTCTNAGNSQRECVNDCDTIDTRSTGYAALGHEGTIAAFAATCTTAGNSALSGNCVRFAQCAHVVTGTVIPINDNHDWNSALETISEGVEAITCKRVGCNGKKDYAFQYAIGNTGPAGGIIFYVAPSGFTVQGYSGATGSFAEYTAYYLEAAPANEPNSRWQSSVYANHTLIDGITTWVNVTAKNAGLASSIGVGRKDTQTIVNSPAFAALTNTAAQRCANKTLNGFTDWFLPSLGELNEMYKARVAGVTGIPITGDFWSSSQGSSSSAWDQGFASGSQSNGFKEYSDSVRAVRAF